MARLRSIKPNVRTDDVTMHPEEIRHRLREASERNRETDRRALAAVGLGQSPNPYDDMDWPDVRQPGSGLPDRWEVS